MKNLIFIILFTTSLSAQIKGKVVDEKNSPIAYVNIWVENENIGTTANENGEFNINTTADKKLIFTAVGFETLTSKISENGIITLKTYIEELEEVVIGNPKGTEEIELGDLKPIYGGYACVDTPWKIAQFFPNNDTIKKHPYLKNLTFCTKSEIKKAKIIIHFYDVNEDGTPAKDLLDENFVYEVGKGSKKSVVDLSNLKIKFPKKGLFVGFEWMIIDENIYRFKYTKDGDIIKKNYDGVKYCPTLKGLKKKIFGICSTWNGKWSKPNRDVEEKYKSRDLALKLTLTN